MIWIWFGLNFDFISKLYVIDYFVSFLLDSGFGGPTSKGSNKKGKILWYGEFDNKWYWIENFSLTWWWFQAAVSGEALGL